MDKVRARHKGRKYIYVHNDLANAAHHFHEQIKRKRAAGDLKGHAFERLACMILLAFTFEAQLNFLGHKKVRDWKERQAFDKKVTALFVALELTPDWNARPYSSLAALKTLRDLIAHGKPHEAEFDEIVEEFDEEIDRKIDLDSEWFQYCSEDKVHEAYEDMDRIWEAMLNASGLHTYDTITRGESGLTLLERLDS